MIPFKHLWRFARHMPLLAVAVLLLPWPALAASPDRPLRCDPANFDARPQLVSLRDALAADAFAEAYTVFLEDIDASLATGDDIYRRMQAWRDGTCQPVLDELHRHDSAVREYERSECGAKTVPEGVVKGCIARFSELQTRGAALDTRRLDALDASAKLSGESATLEPVMLRAVGNAENMLNPDNVEQVFRLYVFWLLDGAFSGAPGGRDSCHAFTAAAKALGRRVTNQEMFINVLTRNVIEPRLVLAFFAGNPPLRPVTLWRNADGRLVRAFNASGFRPQFIDLPGDNQVRHAASYIRAGFSYVGTAARVRSFISDIVLSSEDGDYQLAVEGAQMGFQLRRGKLNAANFGAAMEARFCQ